MELKIDKETIEATTGCENKYACFLNNLKNCCKVDELINNEVLFIKCLKYKNCKSKISFGISFICTCPARKEIFIKYNI